MNADTINDLSLWVTVGAVVFAVVVAFSTMRLSASKRSAADKWRKKAQDLDHQLGRAEAVFGAYPGLILVWEQKVPDPDLNWGDPIVYGSAAALASLVRFAEPGKPKEFARRLLDGIADFNTLSQDGSDRTLRQLISALRENGEGFSTSITLAGGKLIEVDGNVAGAQVVVWLEDASIRGRDEKDAITKFEKEKLIALTDPVAFVEIMGKAPFPLWRMSGTGRIVWANKAYCDYVGVDNVQTVLADQIQLDNKCVAQAHKAMNENIVVKEARPLIVNGKVKPSTLTMFPVSGGIAGIVVDASEASQLRTALTNHIRAHDETLNNMGEAVVIFGVDQRMNFHNTAFATMFGLDENWFKLRPSHGEWLDHMREKRRLPEQPDYRDWKRAELSFYTDWPDEMTDELWSLPDGREIRLVRMRDPEGGLSLLFGDMTDQMTMRSRLGTLINVQKATLDKLTEGVAVFGPDGRLKIHNAAYETMWSLPSNALKDEPLFRELTGLHLKLYHDRAFWSEMVARTTDPSPEARRHVNGEIRRSDDTILTFLSKPLPDGATLIAWDDITRSRRTEDAYRERAEALEAADRLKTEFVGHVSYQLRTPLTTISGYAEFLQSGVAGELTDKQSEYIFAIQTASEELAKTFNDILDIAAVEADAVDLDLGDVEIYYLLENALDYVVTKVEDTQIKVVLECPTDIGIIRADEKRIKQIVQNLISNAIRFTKPGGNIEIGASKDASGDGSGIRIWVKDDGIGIPAERQPQVFESFKSTRGGTGLGLALVERFVAQHGGWVELESEEGMGTHVTCHLPREASLGGAHPELDL
ncbi:MAG: tyrosine protein kinase [Robiginitomaculum sp.]|nr:MAG: tyrosine protein kinase [Robiginitomaculum sp.]